jgi:DNA-binding IclR family transcriptional regulator
VPRKAQTAILLESHAACLIALRHRPDTKTGLAIAVKISIKKATAALSTLSELGLADKDQTNRWFPTVRGKICQMGTVPERRREGVFPGPGEQRLLDLLQEPMRGSDIAKKLSITRQRVRQLLLSLHAQGRVRLLDPRNPLWGVARFEDDTNTLTRDELRVLQVMPREYATTATKIRLAASLPENSTKEALGRLIALGFVDAFDGLKGQQVFRITQAGVSHPQLREAAHFAPAPRMPVESDRVHDVLNRIAETGAMRIRDLTEKLGIERRSMNALMQYLKRKQLVMKEHEPHCTIFVDRGGTRGLSGNASPQSRLGYPEL